MRTGVTSACKCLTCRAVMRSCWQAARASPLASSSSSLSRSRCLMAASSMEASCTPAELSGLDASVCLSLLDVPAARLPHLTAPVQPAYSRGLHSMFGCSAGIVGWACPA